MFPARPLLPERCTDLLPHIFSQRRELQSCQAAVQLGRTAGPRPEQKSPPASVRSRPGPSGPGSCRPLWQCRLTSLFFPSVSASRYLAATVLLPGRPGTGRDPRRYLSVSAPWARGESRCSPRHSLKGRETGRPPPGAPEGCSAPDGSGTAYGSPFKASLPQQSAPHYN